MSPYVTNGGTPNFHAVTIPYLANGPADLVPASRLPQAAPSAAVSLLVPFPTIIIETARGITSPEKEAASRTRGRRGLSDASVAIESEKLLMLLSGSPSNRSLKEFMRLRTLRGVNRVIDIRTVSLSRHNPQFNHATLLVRVRQPGIGYRPNGGPIGLPAGIKFVIQISAARRSCCHYSSKAVRVKRIVSGCPQSGPGTATVGGVEGEKKK
jgi:Domain of unknown function DUF488